MSAVDDRVGEALRTLEAGGSTRFRNDLERRYGIVTKHAYGTRMAGIKSVAKRLGRDHELARALWSTGVYEARLLASLVGEPARVTPDEMDAWCADFDNWAVTDTICFNLYDRTGPATVKVAEWARLEGEFQRRAAFSLLAAMAIHRKDLPDEWFVRQLPLVDAAATDSRNFVKKGVSWALRSYARRRDPKVRLAAMDLARRLAESDDRARRWVGKDALKGLAARE
ncbi:MAG TPA: DNA alkylation repair protein [Longimicrobiales bacterium]|nr:DNA alkylation repair protein [Longimicrobiales bacterium]